MTVASEDAAMARMHASNVVGEVRKEGSKLAVIIGKLKPSEEQREISAELEELIAESMLVGYEQGHRLGMARGRAIGDGELAGRVNSLRAMLVEVLASARPNEREHPTMSKAWKRATALLEKDGAP